MLVIADRVKETTTTTGAGAVALGGAMTGFRSFSAVCAVSDTVFYAIQLVDANGAPANEWEVGLGTYSALNTLTRTTPQASSNGGAAVNFSVGTKQVWIDLTATQLAGLAAVSYVDGINATLSAAIALKAATAYVDAADTALAGAVALKAPLASPALTGTPTAPTAAVDTNTTQLATTAFVIAQAYAKLASPAFTGSPTAPTQAANDNSTRLATTAYADAIAALKANLAGPTFTGTVAVAALTASGAVSGAGFDAYLASPPAIGGTVAAAISGTTITATTKFVAANGTPGAPGYAMTGDTACGLFYVGSGFLGVVGSSGVRLHVGATGYVDVRANIVQVAGGAVLGWVSGALSGGASDVGVTRAAANSLIFGAGTTATTTSRTELNKAVTAIADAAATAVLTITVPNAAHSASLLVRVTGSLGAGGAIGANEATATNTYIVSLTRTAGVNATAAISTAFGAAATAVAGAATVTCTAALSAVSGAVGASNTFTVNVTITRSGGSSTNHTCLVYAQLMNANATGITIA